ncbi:MAG TPA: arsenate reductase ArsC [Gemmatimonadaceae bacterium]|nr:arsenate reductase ArsC [Gemmatimonadaceae bacterium]
MTTDQTDRANPVYRVLFVCTENSNRSQMAEAFARMHGAGLIAAVSAGSMPSGVVSPRAIEAMRERGYDLATHRSKTMQEVEGDRWDAVITMGCGDACPLVPAARREDWDLPDPRDLQPAEFRKVRDEIERRVQMLIAEFRQQPATPGAPQSAARFPMRRSHPREH